MQIHTTARHLTLDSDTRAFAQQRLERLERFLREHERGGAELNLIVTAESSRTVAELTLRVRRQSLIGREDGADARAAIDRAALHLEHRLRKVKDRAAERRRGDRVRAAEGFAPPPEPTQHADDAEVEAWLMDELPGEE